MTVRVGLGTLSGQVAPESSAAETYRETVDLAVAAEQAGLDSVWISEHHGTESCHIPSPLIILSAIAARTSRIELGTGIAIAPFQHPIRFAEDCAVLDQISKGRLRVGLGAGWRPEEFTQFNVPISQRGTRTAELAEICSKAWLGLPFSHSGPHFEFTEVTVTPPSFHRIPIYMVGSTLPAISRAARMADGYFANGIPKIGIEELKSRIEQLAMKAEEADRDPSKIAIIFAVNAWATVSARSLESVREAMWKRITASLAWHAGVRSSVATEVDANEVNARSWIGSPSEIVARAAEWVTPFQSHDVEIVFRLGFPGIPAGENLEQVSVFGDEVARGIRSL